MVNRTTTTDQKQPSNQAASFWLKLVNVQEIIHTLETFNPLILIPCIGLMIFGSIFKAIRFKVLLAREVKVPAIKMINLTFLSQLLSFTIPIRAGEIAKGVYLSTEYELHFGKAIVWVFLDRFLDFWAVLGLALIILEVIPTNLPSGLSTSLLFGVAIASLMVILIVLKPDYFKKLANILVPVLVVGFLKKKFLSFATFIIDCFALLRGDLNRSLTLLFLTILAAFFEGLTWYLIFRAFIPDVSLFRVLLS